MMPWSLVDIPSLWLHVAAARKSEEIAHDEDAMRIRYYWSAVVAPNESVAAMSAWAGELDMQRPSAGGRPSGSERGTAARPDVGAAAGAPAIITLSEPVMGPPNAVAAVSPRGAAGSSPPPLGEGE